MNRQTNETTDQRAGDCVPGQTYAPWVGVVMGLLFPGAAHFFSGKRFVGVVLYLIWFVVQLVAIMFFAIPGKIALYCLGGWAFVAVVYYIFVLVYSYRPTNRLGWSGWILFLVFLICFANFIQPCFVRITFKKYCAETFKIVGNSMAPTLRSSSEKPDRVAVNKMIYRFSEPNRGDIVVYRTKTSDGKPVVWTHRLVGLPGETVDIESPYVLIDGKKVAEPLIFETMAEKKNGYSGYCSVQDIGLDAPDQDIDLPFTLGPDEYFVLGDNSERSLDSRFAGPVKRKDIIGKMVRIYWPSERFGDLK